MILVDTSVWVDHLRRGNTALAARLERGEVLCHPFIVRRNQSGLASRPGAPAGVARRAADSVRRAHTDVLALASRLKLAGRGIGWVDAHLVASARAHQAFLWTLDRRLASVARSVKVGIDA